MKQYNLQEISSWVHEVRAGEQIYLCGTLYTARDAAHKRLVQDLALGLPSPFPLMQSTIYYAGPTPPKHGMPVGSYGPTTSYRMDPYTPALMEKGVLCTIGKGDRSPIVYDAIRKHGGIYLCALGGCGALYADAIISSEVIAYPALGCESIKRMTIERFPVFVGIDTNENSIFHKE